MDATSLLQKIVVVTGPTASGKSTLAVSLAKRFHGEVISADSRQVYRTLDIGTNKTTPEEMRGIPHHLINIREPEQVYTAADFVRDADEAIAGITNRGKLPIVAGGTLFYIDALLGRAQLAAVPANPVLRTELNTRSTEELFETLRAKDPARAEHIDRQNKRRLIRALEIVAVHGSVPKKALRECYDVLIIGLEMPPTLLRERIAERIEKELIQGLVQETQNLLGRGLSKTRLSEIGLEYRVALAHLRGEISRADLPRILTEKVWQYAKRQITWLKKMQSVQWVQYDKPEKTVEAVSNFLTGS